VSERRCGPQVAALRWPVQPLLDNTSLTPSDLRTLVGGGKYGQLVAEGLTDQQADRWAIRGGVHPGCVWDSWFDAALTPLDEAHVAGGWRQAWLWADEQSERCADERRAA
jgi:hypothetical protein